MTEYLIELYAPSADGARLTEGTARLGRQIHVIRSIFVAEDQTCFVLVEAASAEDVYAAAERAHLELDRVVETTLDVGC